MSKDAADHPGMELPAVSWDGQDAPARRASLTRILVRISRHALQGDDLDAVLQGLCECLVAELPVAIASVILLDDANTHFIHEVCAGEWTVSPLAADGTWPVTRGAAGRCVQLGVPHLITDVDADPDYVAGNASVRSEYLVPIRHGARLHGVLNIESTRHDFFEPEARQVFDAVADLVAGAIHFARVAEELTQANRKLEQLSMIDGLTGIANRRRFDRQLGVEWRRLGAAGRPLALLMVDADAFKPLNDASGHLYGDECLRELARICEAFVESEDDVVARFGGEEFVLLLPGRDLARASAIAEALRAAVEAKALPHPASNASPHVTVSVGVASAVPNHVDQSDHLIERADRALYAAKRQGRNRVSAEP